MAVLPRAEASPTSDAIKRLKLFVFKSINDDWYEVVDCFVEISESLKYNSSMLWSFQVHRAWR